MAVALPKRSPPRFWTKCSLSYPARCSHELDPLVTRGKLDQLFQPSEPGLFFLGAGHPSGSHPPIIGRKLLVVLPSGGLLSEFRFQLLLHLARQHRSLAPLL